MQERTFQPVGSANIALTINTVNFFFGFMPISVMSRVVVEMDDLNDSLKALLLAAASISLTLMQIPAGRAVERNGGIPFILAIRLLSCVGAIGLTLTAALADVEEIEGVSVSFCAMFGFAMLLGLAGGSFQLLNNGSYWVAKKDIPSAQAIHGGIGGLAPAVTLFLLNFFYEDLGAFGSFLLFSGLQITSLIVSAQFSTAPPFYQALPGGQELPFNDPWRWMKMLYRAVCCQGRGGFTEAEQAGASAEVTEWENSNSHTEENQRSRRPLATQTDRWVISYLTDQRVYTTVVSVMALFGGFLAASISFQGVLIEDAEFSKKHAFYLTAIMALLTTIVRAITGKLITRFDPETHGVKVHTVASSLAILGALMLGVSNDLKDRGPVYVWSASSIMGVGFGLGATCTFSLAKHWSQARRQFTAYPVGRVIGLVGTFGASSGLVLTQLQSSVVVSLLQLNAARYFVFTAAFNLLTLGLVWRAHKSYASTPTVDVV